MLKIEINPSHLKAEILKNLNLCFPNWGSNIQYHWYFERSVTELKPDIIIFRNESDEIIAGSAISYRQIKLSDHKIYQIGIMTGSWTLPAARGMGCFTEMINTSKVICKEKNVDFLTAFVTEDNPSYRRLHSAGSYCLSIMNYSYQNDNQIDIVSGVEELDLNNYSNLKEIVENHYHHNFGFNYSFESFEKQYIKRLSPVKVFKYKNQLYVVENANITKLLFTSEVDKVHVLDMIKWLNQTFKTKVWFFCSNPNFYDYFSEELLPKAGFFTILPTNDLHKTDALFNENMDFVFNIQLGDKV